MNMFDIVTMQPEDNIVETAINSIIQGKGVIPSPNGNYRYFAVDTVHTVGDGGAGRQVLVVVGHGSPNTLSGYESWKRFKEDVNSHHKNSDIFGNKKTVYIAACSIGGEGNQFLYGNIAQEIKNDFPNATVWVSISKVGSITQSGDWQQLK
jgi:hypothetical protein